MKNLISNTIKEVFKNNKILKEYITNNEIYLRDYLSMPESSRKQFLPDEYYYLFDDFLEETGIDFEMPKETVPSNYADEPDEEVDMFDDNLELMTYLMNYEEHIYESFADYLYDKILGNTLPIDDSEYPAWSYFSDNPELIKNQWLIHFTNDAEGISNNGFKYGVDDMTKLGLTTNMSEFDKKYGGYNFAYTLNDFVRYSKRSYTQGGGYKYGKEAVIFNASGIKVWHHGDEEPQVIFYGNTAKNIISITAGEEYDWGVYNKTGKILFENSELEKVVKWITQNYQQYRKILR
jgi:hypothetical protein